MLTSVDLTAKVERDEYNEQASALKIGLRNLQHRARSLKIPIIIMFEGWDTAGKGDAIQHVTEMLDPRGFDVHFINFPTTEEKMYPWLRRFWTKIPDRGRMSFFEHSWYNRVLQQKVEALISPKDIEHSFLDIESFENLLFNDGYLILKFWLHLSKKQQRKRLKQAEEDPFRRFIVTETEWERHNHYEEYHKAVAEMLERTNTVASPWKIIAAANRRHRRLETLRYLTNRLTTLIEEKEARLNAGPLKQMLQPTAALVQELEPIKKFPLKTAKTDGKLESNEYKKRLEDGQIKIRQLQQKAFLRKLPISIVFEGWDAAGKGGSIKRMVRTLDPRGYTVVPIGKPTQIELDHHYLWRFWKKIPCKGHITIFDRSWYGRVLVERVEGFAKEHEWKRAYEEINDFERKLHDAETVQLKFWINISKEEQLSRFKARSQDPHKSWKLTEEDWRNRDKWDDYVDAVNEMIVRTSTDVAPWTIISGNDKYFARVQVLETVCDAIEKALD
ncbi:MAG: phosphate--AMP phosphotransferase [Sumerlaeia bacterium]